MKESIILLILWNLGRVIHFELALSFTKNDFIKSLTKLIATKGKPITANADNVKTFKATANMLKKMNKDMTFYENLLAEKKYEVTIEPRLSHKKQYEI